MKRYVFDIEADSLNPIVIWCLCVIDVDTGEEHGFRDLPRFKQFLDLLDPSSTIWIGHNILGYDLPALARLWDIHLKNVVDTLVVSRLLNFPAAGGHSLRRWGERLGCPKFEYNEWTAFSDPQQEHERLRRLLEYCLQDCRVNVKIFKALEKYIYSPGWKQSLRVEHEIARICREMHDSGFRFDMQKAEEIYADLSKEVEDLSARLKQAFPPRAKFIREVTPRETKFGTISRSSLPRSLLDSVADYSIGASFTHIDWIEFNPASPHQVVERLNETGWEPFEKTDGHRETEKELSKLQRLPKAHRDEVRLTELKERLQEYSVYGWKVSEENLETLPEDAPEGTKILVKWRMLSKRLQTLEEWRKAYRPETSSIHGTFNHIGAWTHRMSHSDPNQGNVPSVDSKYHNLELKQLAAHYGEAMRSCFTVRDGNILVGTDADGIQLRILAHYMEDEEFIEALINGDKDKGTDVHTLNALKLSAGISNDPGAVSRPRAKTFIYAWLLGAGLGKVGKILGFGSSEAARSVQSFINGYPGLRRLKEEIIPADAARGYFVGFDGRQIRTDEYHMLAGYLQTGEQAIMKHATILWQKAAKRDRLKFELADFVHDEWQTEVWGGRGEAEYLGQLQRDSIRQTGIDFGLKCELAGNSKYGRNWFDTH